ncbi:MAG: hypothetical protein HC842_04880 [Cytophagales bacterium]|nr:hypothetical protein [Cytophagales bacterium]
MNRSKAFIFLLAAGLTAPSLMAQPSGASFDSQAPWIATAGYKAFDFPPDTVSLALEGMQAMGIFPATVAFQQAIDRCHHRGGGVVWIPKGTYLLGSIFLKSGVHLAFEDSTLILGSSSLSDYPIIDTRVAGIEMEWPTALITLKNAKNVKISGRAEILGRGRIFWAKFHYMKPLYEQNALRWAVDYDCQRPRMLLVQESENVHISGITLRESPFGRCNCFILNK